MFEIKDRDACGRIGILETAHGTITTPTVLPVVNPSRLTIPPAEMIELGAQAVITNAYIIFNQEELHRTAVEHGVHRLIDFSGPIMTDSGSFQLYEYGGHIDPLEIVTFQRDIGTDIGTILDVFSLDADYPTAKKQVAQTLNRARESVPLKKEMYLACTVQGGNYPNLRRRCAVALAEIDADIHPIGGVVPLMEQQRYLELASIIIAAKKGLPPQRPVHLFGAGHPLVFPLAVALGCDLFDSSAYIKYAVDGRMLLPDGTAKLSDLDELPCPCPVCNTTSVAELHSMEVNQRIKELARHNLYVTFSELRRIRKAIRDGWLWELVAQRARAHPRLLESLNAVKQQKSWLERWEPVSKKRALMYTGRFTLHRPGIYRLHQRLLTRITFPYPQTVLVTEQGKPYTRINPELTTFKANVLVLGPLGPIPLELEDMYPIAQSVFPVELDGHSKQVKASFTRRLLQRVPPVVDATDIRSNAKDFDVRKIQTVADFQFGTAVGVNLFSGRRQLIKSPSTHKIRNVLCDGKHVASLRAGDGLFTLRSTGAKRLHACLKGLSSRVVIADEAVPFVRDGKSVFSKFVLDADQALRPYDEVLIVDGNDTLIAVGQCYLNREEMLAFGRGVAVKTREGLAQ